MSTITVWLLISLGSHYVNSARPSVLIDRFVTMADCEHVRKAITDGFSAAPARCVQATIMKP